MEFCKKQSQMEHSFQQFGFWSVYKFRSFDWFQFLQILSRMTPASFVPFPVGQNHASRSLIPLPTDSRPGFHHHVAPLALSLRTETTIRGEMIGGRKAGKTTERWWMGSRWRRIQTIWMRDSKITEKFERHFHADQRPFSFLGEQTAASFVTRKSISSIRSDWKFVKVRMIWHGSIQEKGSEIDYHVWIGQHHRGWIVCTSFSCVIFEFGSELSRIESIAFSETGLVKINPSSVGYSLGYGMLSRVQITLLDDWLNQVQD
jgi:hypothetical protein